MEQKNNSKPKKRSKKQRYTLKHQLLRLPWLLLIVLGLCIPKLFSGHSHSIETVYSRTIYPVISSILASLTSLVPLSVAEVLIVVLPVLFLLILVIRLIRVAMADLALKHYYRLRFYSFIISLGIFTGIMLNAFYCVWGLNYLREPLAYTLNLNVRERPVDELASVYTQLAQEAVELRSYVDEDYNGIYTVSNLNDGYKSVVLAYRKLGESNSVFDKAVYKAKSVALSEIMSKLGIAGIYIPFTGEMNLNVNQPDLYILADAAHETAHYMGFAREDEANFLAFYVSQFSDDASLRYSATMLALVNCGNKLVEKDPELYYSIRGAIFTEGMERDLEEYRNYYNTYDKTVTKSVSNNMNDAYLKHNGLDDGINSYGRMVDLILAYYESIGKIN